jgi:hypothetical protein
MIIYAIPYHFHGYNHEQMITILEKLWYHIIDFVILSQGIIIY